MPQKKGNKTQNTKEDPEKTVNSLVVGLTHSDDAKKRSALILLQGLEDSDELSVELGTITPFIFASLSFHAFI